MTARDEVNVQVRQLAARAVAKGPPPGCCECGHDLQAGVCVAGCPDDRHTPEQAAVAAALARRHDLFHTRPGRQVQLLVELLDFARAIGADLAAEHPAACRCDWCGSEFGRDRAAVVATCRAAGRRAAAIEGASADTYPGRRRGSYKRRGEKIATVAAGHTWGLHPAPAGVVTKIGGAR